MRDKKFFIRVSALFFAAVIAFSAFAFSAYAADEVVSGDNNIDVPVADDPAVTPDPDTPGSGGDLTGDPVPDYQGQAYVEPTDPPADSGDGGNGYDEYIEATEAENTYTEPEHLNELPTAVSGEVIEATAVVLPDVEVSEASLFSGIIMWLCVAVGIAVIVGVLVSKRAHRRGP